MGRSKTSRNNEENWANRRYDRRNLYFPTDRGDRNVPSQLAFDDGFLRTPFRQLDA